MGPILKFKLNINLDQQTVWNFLDLKCAGIDFGKGIISDHPLLKNVQKISSIANKKKAISQYVTQFYKLNQSKLRNRLNFIKKEWKKVEQNFLRQTNTIFNNQSWPKGKYICYLSIFNCNPRFIKNKTFQVFYKNKKEAKRIISHELLHFIFYDYLNKKIKIKILENKKWVISEVFNTIILNQKNFQKIISPVKELGYPEHKKYFKVLTKEWTKCKDIEMWLKKAIKLVP